MELAFVLLLANCFSKTLGELMYNSHKSFNLSMGKREENKIRNEKEILTTAIQLFIEKGDEQTTISDIVAATDLAFGTFYNYFKNKSEIWDRIIDHFMINHAYPERQHATSIYDFIYNSLSPILSEVCKEPYQALINRNPNSFRAAYFRSAEIEVNISVFERDMRASKLFVNLPDHYFRMTIYGILGTCFEILIQSYSNGDGFSAEQINDYVSSTFERSLSAEIQFDK